jgi:hypothetical protein
MSNYKLGVAKVKGIEPEQFFIFLMSTEGSKGLFMRTSGFCHENMSTYAAFCWSVNVTA